LNENPEFYKAFPHLKKEIERDKKDDEQSIFDDDSKYIKPPEKDVGFFESLFYGKRNM